MVESSSSIRDPCFCRHMNQADEVLLAIPSDVASKLWGDDKAPTNVLIQSEDGRTFNVSLSEAKGRHFFFHGWSNVVIHLRLKKGCLVVFNPVDYTTFKVTYFINGVSRSSFWTSLLSTTYHFTVIPECILPKSYDYTSNDTISTINIGNKTFHVKIETLDGKAGFTNGIDVIVAQFQLEADCYLLFTNFFGNYFHVRIFGKNGVENNFVDVEVDEPLVALIDSVAEPVRLPDNVSRMAKLDSDLKPITVRLLHLTQQEEFTNYTRREKKDNGFRYALSRWSRFMKCAGIKVGDTVHYSFDETDQVLNVELNVPHIRCTG
ncbi:putative transcription factor B3-Domain family [Helianthus anomalus]